MAVSTPLREPDPVLEHNRRFYDSLWSRTLLVAPERFNTWPRVRELVRDSTSRLEVGAGLRPRLPLRESLFTDISRPALKRLRAAGGRACCARLQDLPFRDGAFDLVAALDILEHVGDDEGALGELRRVLHPGGKLLLSFPLYQARWTDFDAQVGHHRRYEPEQVRALLDRFGIRPLESAVYGMKPRSSRLVSLGMGMLEKMPRHAMWCYNHLFMPLGVRMQKPLHFQRDWIVDPAVDEIILLCERE
jgi:SAM-dependent methyltransferase